MNRASSDRRILSAPTICALTLGALMISALITGCGGSGRPSPITAAPTVVTTAPRGTVLTTAQAVRLSRAFFNNYDGGGAHAVVDVPFGRATSIRIDALVDWKTHTGQGRIITTFTDGRPQRTQPLWWFLPNDLTKGVIVTEQDGLPEAMAQADRTGIRYLSRPVSEKSALDLVVRFLDKMSADRAENPVLLRQADVGFLAAEEVAGVLCDRVRFGSRGTEYWIAAADGRLRRVSARLAGLTKPTEFLLDDHGPQTITAPLDAEVVDARDIPDVYNRLLQRKP